MTSEDTRKTPPETTPSETAPAKKNRRFLWVCALFVALAGFLILVFFEGSASFHKAPPKNDAVTQALSRLNAAQLQNETTLAALAAKQTQTGEILEKLEKSQQATPASDPALDSTYTALSALEKQFNDLSADSLIASASPQPSADNTARTLWQQIRFVTKQIWSQLVTVRHAGEDQHLLTPAAVQLILLRLQSEVSAAKWALLHHDPVIYAAALDNVRDTLKHYFADRATEDMMSRLTALKTLPSAAPHAMDSN